MSREEALRIIERLERAVTERKIVLIGGQAVAVWASQLADYLEDETEPIASRDVDFQGRKSDVELAADLLGGRLYVPGWDDHTPMSGKDVFLDSEGYERTLDFPAQPYGLDAADVSGTAIEVDVELENGRVIPLERGA